MSSEAILFGFLPDRATRIRQAISMLKQSDLSFSIHSNIKKIDEPQSISISTHPYTIHISIDSVGRSIIKVNTGDKGSGLNLLNFIAQVMEKYGVELENKTYG
jgi:hypothetical protein